MRTVQTLIDECVEMCGGQSALARALGIKPNDVSVMQRGKRPISPATVGLLCDVLKLPGEEASRLAVLAVIQNAKPEKQGVLRRAFFELLTLGVTYGAVVMTTNNAQARTDETAPITEEVDSLYIVALWQHRCVIWLRLRGWLHAYWRAPCTSSIPWLYATHAGQRRSLGRSSDRLRRWTTTREHHGIRD